MSDWITDRKPTAEDACKDADPVLYDCVIVQGRDNKLYRKWYNVTSGEAWQCIPWENADEPIAKAKRRATMSDWITDRRPTAEDCGGGLYVVYDSHGMLVHFVEIDEGEPWKPVPKCEPYVKPKRWFVVWSDFRQCWALRDHKTGATICLRDDSMNVGLINRYDKDREAAERIAATYEEVMP